jgi:O-methyltransferase domain
MYCLQQALKGRNTIAQGVLDCLIAMGYAEKNSKGYKFSKRGMKFLDKNSRDNMLHFILFCDWTYNSFINLEETIKQGKPPKINIQSFGDHEWELFSRAMIDIAKTNLKEVTGKIRLPDSAVHLIDLGGSHGLYSIELCKKYKNLSAAILDFEPVKKYTDECIDAHKMQSRVQFTVTDFIKGQLPVNKDAALLFNIIHGFTPEQNQNLISKIFASLNKNGQLIILDQVKGTGGKSQMSLATTSFMAINLFHQANGNTYSFNEIKEWCEFAGFRNLRMKKINAPGFALISCEK